MSKHSFIFFMACIGFCIGLASVMSSICITSAFTGWEANLYFNEYHEGLIEAVLSPLATVFAFWGVMKMCIQKKREWKVELSKPTSSQTL